LKHQCARVRAYHFGRALAYPHFKTVGTFVGTRKQRRRPYYRGQQCQSYVPRTRVTSQISSVGRAEKDND
jgi:hypothetical protein